jgi:hypothetical protein
MWDDLIYVEHCAVFGLAPARGIQGAPADALIDILAHEGIAPVLKWVNDFIFFRSPTISCSSSCTGPSFTYDLDSILDISRPLGIPWHPIAVKGQIFLSSVTYVGFVWDLNVRTVSLPEKK